MLDKNFAGLIKKVTQTLQLAREKESDSRREQRVERIIEEFAEDHPTGCVRDRASAMLRRIDAAADDTTAGDTIRAGTARLRRDFALGTDPLERLPDYENFLERLKHLPVLVRLRDQGRLAEVELEQVDAADTGK